MYVASLCLGINRDRVVIKVLEETFKDLKDPRLVTLCQMLHSTVSINNAYSLPSLSLIFSSYVHSTCCIISLSHFIESLNTFQYLEHFSF